MNPEKGYQRRLYSDEKLWLSMQQLGLSAYNEWVVEGTGDIPSKEMNNALKEVSLLYPICRSRLSGYLKNLSWKESVVYPSFIRMGATINPFGKWPTNEEMKVFQAELNLKKESPFRVYSLYDGQKHRFYFKAHHSSMDGLGAYFIIEDIFRILRGEKPIGPTKGPDTKAELYKAILPDDFFEKRRQAALKNKDQKTNDTLEGGSLLFNGVYEGKHPIRRPSKCKQVQWCSILIPWDRISASKLNAKIVVAIMETIKRRNPDLKNKRIQAWLPIDLRKFLSGSRKTSNLTGIISLELNKYFDIPPVVRVFPIQDNIVERINDFSWVINPTPMIDWFPVKLLSAIIFSFLEIAFYRKKNPYFFSISNLGRFKLSDLSTEDFKADRIFGIPPFPLGCPLIALPANHDNGLELTCITNTDKDPFIEFIDQLEEEIYSLEKQLSSKAASD